ncbi:MAG TPA: FecR family protein [Polyangia bacterium]|jgi:ferric-dicitrate binding protein FerR (iron transport regulator)
MSAADRDARVEAEIAAPLRDAEPAVDELHRARLVGAIDAALDREDAARAARRDGAARDPRPRRRARLVAAAVAAAAAAATLALALGLRHQAARAPGPVPAPAAALAPAPSPSIDRTPALLHPYRAPADSRPPSTSLVALAGERARATIGTRVRLTLVGAGRVSVLAAARDGDIELALDAGRLLVDYHGHAGGTLRVRSPGALTTVVGTLFAVEVTGAGSRVAVARGRVEAQASAGGAAAEIAAGRSWTSADGRLAPIADELAAALAEHLAVWTPPAGSGPARGKAADRPEPARPPPVRATPDVDLDALYAKAESAMRERSLAEARRALEIIAARDPRGALGEAALLDLARLALADGDRAEARRALARLPSPLRDPALAETAAHLRARAEAPGAGE